MGKQGKNSLGRALVKDRFGSTKGKKKVDNGSMLHTTEVADGYDWGRLNLQSVTEESSFQEFLSTATLAGTEFQAEKLNLKLVSIEGVETVASPEVRAKTEKKHAESKHLLRVPRRPPWNKEMTPEQLQENERQAFLNWRRDLAQIQEKDSLIITPYEKNLEFWRQLWRVLERSQLLVQVLDARNPLLFRCEDLEQYAKEVGVKELLLLLNKADLLSQPQREAWAQYFDQQGIKVAFFSAVLAAEITKLENAARRRQMEGEGSNEEEEEKSESDEEDEPDEENTEEAIKEKTDEAENCEENKTTAQEDGVLVNTLEGLRDRINKLDFEVEKTSEKLKNIEKKIEDILEHKPTFATIPTPTEDENSQDKDKINKTTDSVNNEESTDDTSKETKVESPSKASIEKHVTFAPLVEKASVSGSNSNENASDQPDICNVSWSGRNSPNILTREELIDLLISANCGENGRFTVGMVGYPNVGKSSTINALMTSKKVSVSATPGKTKHFQTLILTDNLMLCDCPGLVLPSFVCTKADMVLHGILPIDQMREYMEAIGLLIEGLGGRRSAERRLGLLLPPAPEDNPDYLPPRDLLLAYAYSRGMMTGAGTPDCARAARAVLHAACAGRLPLALPPPNIDADHFRTHAHPPLPPEDPGEDNRREMTPQEKRALKSGENADDLDKAFFTGPHRGAHAKGVVGKLQGLPTARMVNGSANPDLMIAGKPWKHTNRHANKNKKEKLRRVYAHLDQH